MSQATTTHTTASNFVAYEYTTVRATRELEPLYKDAYGNFGWIIEDIGVTVPGANTVALKLKRDRRLKNRPMILELQRKCENALTSIASMERSKSASALATALTLGIIGAAFLAGSIFALNAGLTVLSIVLGAIGLVGWVAGYFSHGRVLARKTEKLTPLIDRQYDVVFETGEQASRLLA